MSMPRPLYFCLFGLLFCAPLGAQKVFINEIMASNRLTIADPAGEFDDWAEVYNGDSIPVQLAGMYLSDNPGNPLKWQIPGTNPSETNLPAKSYRLIWLDDAPAQGPLHAPFKLDASGEHLLLSTREGILLDRFGFGPQQQDLSIGRVPDGTGVWVPLKTPSPGAANTAGILPDQAPAPLFSIPGGHYRNGMELALSTPVPQGVVRYTLNGGLPTETDSIYHAPLRLERTSVVRARVFAPGWRPSPVVTQTYFVDVQHTFPIVSIAFEPADFFDPNTGIYANLALAEEERPVHVEWFEPDGTHGFSADMAVELHGKGSLGSAQKSLLLKAKSSFGPSEIKYPVFPDLPYKKYSRLVLRNSGQDWNVTMFRDAFVASLGRDYTDLSPVLDTVHLAFQGFRPSVVYFNGAYWGIYNLHDQIGEEFLSNHFGLNPDSVDFIDLYSEAITGDSAAWFDFWRWTTEHHFQSDVQLQTMAQRQDLDNFTDYTIFQIATDNVDWPLKNWRRFRPKQADGKWHWVPFDFDLSFGLLTTDGLWNTGYAGQNAFARAIDSTFRYPSSPDWSTLYLRRCLENTAFRHRFLNRTADLLNTVFEPQRVINRMAKFRTLYQPEIQAQLERWWLFGQGAEQYWEDNIRQLRHFAEQRAGFCFQHAVTTFPKTTTGTALVTLAVDPPEAGNIEFSTLHFKHNDLPWTGTYFRDIPIPAKAVPNPGWRFKGWSPGEYNSDASTTFILNKKVTLTALFEHGPILSDTQDLAREKVVLTPNPATDQVLVKAITPFLSAQLYNAIGQEMQRWDFTAAPLAEQWLPLREVAPGSYVLAVKLAQGGIFWRRLVVL